MPCIYSFVCVFFFFIFVSNVVHTTSSPPFESGSLHPEMRHSCRHKCLALGVVASIHTPNHHHHQHPLPAPSSSSTSSTQRVRSRLCIRRALVLVVVHARERHARMHARGANRTQTTSSRHCAAPALASRRISQTNASLMPAFAAAAADAAAAPERLTGARRKWCERWWWLSTDAKDVMCAVHAHQLRNLSVRREINDVQRRRRLARRRILPSNRNEKCTNHQQHPPDPPPL